MTRARTREEEILTWCGVVTQLVRTRSNHILKPEQLPYSLFILLRHFCRDPQREWTIGQLTAVFETGQSGMTKRVRHLLVLKYLSTRTDADDGRLKWLRITAAGERQRDKMASLLAPDKRSFFADWSEVEADTLHKLLFRLKSYLDGHREDIVSPRQ